ncbi:MAG: signal peptidase I [Elusimicrobia bacterium RIFOXYA2_FULL_58_8]|nr:MAG: signal peptidase I [Elusimicrobia bacterium RIFOXYA12_FULL_57_11]OGS12493.1 MAG: signal peptidase I [Elusimicrobia bacterium RIFOXYA2_FULL_58_8]
MQPLRTAVIVALTVAGMLTVRQWVGEPIFIASESMAPTLTKGHHLFLDKVTYKFRRPGRGELLAFRSPVGEAHESVKRVIAVGGDTVELRRKKVYINGQPLYENYTQHTRAGEVLAGDDLGPLAVPHGTLFLLGDNRDNSNDSASWKAPADGQPLYFLPLTEVTGKVRGIY